MKKTILYSMLLCSLLYSNEKEAFIEKYISDKSDYQKNQSEADAYRKNISKDVNLKEISKKEYKEIDTTLEANKHINEANKISQDINNEIKSIRAGGIVGKHEIIFGFPFQTVRLTHESISREAFGNGVIFVVKNIIDKEKGFISKHDKLMLFQTMYTDTETIMQYIDCISCNVDKVNECCKKSIDCSDLFWQRVFGLRIHIYCFGDRLFLYSLFADSRRKCIGFFREN